MINTYNESSLHNTLKLMYTETYMGQTEVSAEGYICDVVAGDGTVIEIQTANLHKLLPKLLTLKEKHRIRLVYPLVVEKHILLTDEEGKKISNRRSPKKPDIYAIFDELMGIHPILLEKGFTLEVLSVAVTEERIRTAEPVQLKNRSRRFRKNWYKTGKKLDEIRGRRCFSSREDYLSLLPGTLPEPFCAKDVAVAGVGKQAHKMLWVLRKLELITLVEKKGNTNYFRRTEE